MQVADVRYDLRESHFSYSESFHTRNPDRYHKVINSGAYASCLFSGLGRVAEVLIDRHDELGNWGLSTRLIVIYDVCHRGLSSSTVNAPT